MTNDCCPYITVLAYWVELCVFIEGLFAYRVSRWIFVASENGVFMSANMFSDDHWQFSTFESKNGILSILVALKR